MVRRMYISVYAVIGIRIKANPRLKNPSVARILSKALFGLINAIRYVLHILFIY
jgi:hypothetical protein